MKKIGVGLIVFFLLVINTSMVFANSNFEKLNHEVEDIKVNNGVEKIEKIRSIKANVVEGESLESQNTKLESNNKAGNKSLKEPIVQATVGETIANSFPDPNFAQAVADAVSEGDVNVTLTQTMVDGLTNLDAENKGIQDIKGIDLLSNLQMLFLDNNQITNIADIVKLEKLVDLSLSSNNLISLSENISNLSSLNYLNLDNNNLVDLPESIGSLSSLHILSLDNNVLTSLPESMSNLSSLQMLSLGSNSLTSLPENISNLSRLYYLDLDNNNLVDLPESISKLSSLENLSLNNIGITSLPESIGNLTRLQNLSLDNNGLTQIPESIGKLSVLQRLSLDYNQLTSLPESIGDLRGLVYLELPSNKLTALPETIGSLRALEVLLLEINELTTLPESISNLNSLRHLSLDNNNLMSLPESIGNLSTLKTLYVNSNNLISLPESIGKLSSLKYLSLDDNNFIMVPESITNLSSLQQLSMGSNNLTSLPESIKNLSSLWYFYLENNLLPTNYEITLNTLGLNNPVVYEQQRQLTLKTGVGPYRITSENDFSSISLLDTVVLNDDSLISPAHTLILDNYVDKNNNPVDLNNYIENGVVIKSGEVFAQVRATGAGLFPNNSDHAITVDKIQFNFKAPTVSYDLFFNLNGGEGTAPATQTVVEGETATEVTAPTRSGFIFKGWNTESNGSGTTWEFETTAMPSNNVTLYAQWEENNEAAHIRETVEKGLPKTGNYKLFILGISLLTLGSVLLIKKIKEN